MPMQRTREFSNRIAIICVTVLCGIALFLRGWGMGYGLPHLYFTDEIITVNQTLSMGYFKTLKPDHYIYPTGMMYLLGLLYGLYYLMVYLGGHVHTTMDFALQIISNPTPVYLIARGVSVISGAGMAFLIFLIGRRMFNPRVGLLAAALTAVNSQLVDFAHFVKVETLEGFCVLLAFFLTVKAVQTLKSRAFMVAGLMTGVAVGVKYMAGLVVIAELFMIFSMVKTKDRLPYAAWLILSSMVGFALVMPYAILDFNNFFTSLANAKYFSSYVVHDDKGWLGTCVEVWTLTPTIIFLGGVIFALISRRQAWWSVLLFPIAHFSFFYIFSPWKNIFWHIPVVPFLALMGAGAVICIWDKCHWIVVRATVFLTAVMALGQSVQACLVNDYKLIQPDTRTLAVEWIEKNIPEKSAIVMDHGRYLPGYAPPIQQTNESIDRNYMQTESIKGGWQYREYKKYFELLKKVNRVSPKYDVYPIVHDAYCGRTEFWKISGPSSLAWYQSRGVRYAIFEKDQEYRNLKTAGTCGETYLDTYLALYNDVASRGMLLQTFSPEMQGAGLGPSIHIYCVAPDGECGTSIQAANL